jgi:hypothetical protein
VVFGQRRKACRAIERAGHRATAVIVANDENLDLAAEFGFEAVEHANDFLGAKWNAGYMKAAELGADYMMPVGSDSLVDPELILRWLDLEPDPDRITFTTNYAVVHRDGYKRVNCIVTAGGGGGMMLPKELLQPRRYRPVDSNLQKGCDGSTLRNVNGRLEPCDLHALAVVALQSEQQITSYDALSLRWGQHQVRGGGAIGDLQAVYGRETIDAVKTLYPKRRR